MTQSIERTHVSASNDYRYDPGEGPRDRSLRVGDKERDAVSDILRQGHLEGRLNTDELQARLERCVAAKTYAELDVLVADFPRVAGERRAGQPWGRRPGPSIRVSSSRTAPSKFSSVMAYMASRALLNRRRTSRPRPGTVGGHLAWLAVPLFFFFVVRPLFWRASGSGYARGSWACGSRRTTRVT